MKPEQITAWALDEASAEERQQLEVALLDNPQTKQTAEETKEFCDFLLAELRDDSLALTDAQRDRLKAQPMGQSSHLPTATDVIAPWKAAPRTKWRTGVIVRLAMAACVVLGALWTWRQVESRRNDADFAAADEVNYKIMSSRGTDVDKARQLAETPVVVSSPQATAFGLGDETAEPTKKKSFFGRLFGKDRSKKGEKLPAPPPPANEPETPRLLARTDGAATMTADDVVELKKLQDQTAYGLKFDLNQPAAAPMASDLVGEKTISGSMVAVGNGTIQSIPPARPGSSTLSVTGNVAGAAGIEKSGAGTLVLNGANSYTGGSIVNGGVMFGTTGSAQTAEPLTIGSGGIAVTKALPVEEKRLYFEANVLPTDAPASSSSAVAMRDKANADASMLQYKQLVIEAQTLQKMANDPITTPEVRNRSAQVLHEKVAAIRLMESEMQEASESRTPELKPASSPAVGGSTAVTMTSSQVTTNSGTTATLSLNTLAAPETPPQPVALTVNGGAVFSGTVVTTPGSPSAVMNPQPAALGKALEQQNGVNLMTAPVVTTKSGAVATSVVTRDLVTGTAAAPTDAYYFAFNEGRESPGRKERDELQDQERMAGFRPLKDARSDTESYTRILENQLKDVAREPLSTFSIDVDTAAYANVRRFLNQNTIPPADAVRIEELVNYFPTAEEGLAHDAKEPFAVRVEMAPCPWQPAHRLARIAIKGREIGSERKNSNLVFLVDVSGSMNEPNKLPLVQQSLRMLTGQLGEGDRVTMVVYAGSSGLVLPPTNGENKSEILAAIDKLKAGGSTHGSAGIQLAYEQAVAGFIKEGVNRVILCTDGDFNVGVSSPEALETLITQKAKSGVFLSVLGFGSGNLKDRTMETLADKGNGNYAYIDSLSEARKVLVEQMSGTLVTIAKDVKIQVEFNPAAVRSYRLIGYENRMLAKEDFNDDTKDAGEIGAGHSVVALYEVVPANLPPGAEPRPAVDSLKYQAAAIAPAQLADAAKSGEAMTVKLRYKEPDGDLSKLIEMPVKDEGKTLTASSGEYKFSAAVAGFGLLLRDSAYKGTLSWETVRRLAIDGKGADKLGYRGEFLQLIDKARGLKEMRP